jgi:hypothetical protein
MSLWVCTQALSFSGADGRASAKATDERQELAQAINASRRIGVMQVRL